MVIVCVQSPVYEVPLMLYLKQLQKEHCLEAILQGSDNRFWEDDANWRHPLKAPTCLNTKEPKAYNSCIILW